MLNIVYLGNISAVVHALQRMPGIRLKAWIIEKSDTLSEADLSEAKQGPVYFVSSKRELGQALEEIRPLDLGVIANFGIILSESQLKAAKHGFINAHLGLLPEYPGRTPIRDAIKKGEKTAGVTLHRVTREVDRGPIISRREILAGKAGDAQDTFDRIIRLVPDMIREYLEDHPKAGTIA